MELSCPTTNYSRGLHGSSQNVSHSVMENKVAKVEGVLQLDQICSFKKKDRKV